MTGAFFGWLLGLGRGQKRAVQIIADALLITLSLVLAMALRLDGFAFILREGTSERLAKVLLVVVPLSILFFAKLGLYRAVVRYISSRAFWYMLLGVVLSSGLVAFASWATEANLPRSIPIIYMLIALCLMGGLRYMMRGMLSVRPGGSRNRVIIYGAGASGRQLQMSLVSSPEYYPVAFVDDDPSVQGRTIGGRPVLSPANLPKIIARYGAKRLLLAMPSLPRSERAVLLRKLDALDVQIQTIPGMADLVSGKTMISEIRDVPVEDLLGRDPVPPRTDLMEKDLRDRVVLVTGAGGSIGSELCRQILNYRPKRLVLLEISEYNLYAIDQELNGLARAGQLATEIIPLIGSVQNSGRVLSALREHGVETVYHAAAYKHVPLVEGNVVEGIRNNVFGTQSLAEAAVAAGVKAFILISTDKAVRPTNVMGASKRLAEMVCQSMAQQGTTRFSMVRFGNVLGSSGSVIPLFRRQIAAGGPLTVTNPEITRYFMTIPEAAQLVIQAGAMAEGGEVFVLDMGEPIRIVDLAVRMVILSGHNPVVTQGDGAVAIGCRDIEIRFTGLRPGEKLYEELLISDNASDTEHPRIMTAREVYLPSEELKLVLSQLMQACLTHDITSIRRILVEAGTGYTSINAVGSVQIQSGHLTPSPSPPAVPSAALGLPPGCSAALPLDPTAGSSAPPAR